MFTENKVTEAVAAGPALKELDRKARDSCTTMTISDWPVLLPLHMTSPVLILLQLHHGNARQLIDLVCCWQLRSKPGQRVFATQKYLNAIFSSVNGSPVTHPTAAAAQGGGAAGIESSLQRNPWEDFVICNYGACIYSLYLFVDSTWPHARPFIAAIFVNASSLLPILPVNALRPPRFAICTPLRHRYLRTVGRPNYPLTTLLDWSETDV
ncbi:hypothetical protein J6590_075098 [Homalodisca vitripennis]|nr:hypothetical protein J6590_075098 [Homalodisca vitripennis]